MALHERIRKLTYDDYARLPADRRRHEVIDGEHYVTPAPFTPHQRLVVKLVLRLAGFVEEHGLGEVLTAPHDVVLSIHDIVQPDLLFISNERAGILTEKNTQGAPDLVVEILSESTRRLDEEIKLDLYDRHGVLEYWMVNPLRKAIRVYRRTAEDFR